MIALLIWRDLATQQVTVTDPPPPTWEIIEPVDPLCAVEPRPGDPLPPSTRRIVFERVLAGGLPGPIYVEKERRRA